MVRYATCEPGWRPGYRLHLDTDATARLVLTPRQLFAPDGLPVRFGTGSVLAAGSAASAGKPVRPGESLGEWLLPVSGLNMTDRVRFSFAGLFTNTAATDLPAGDAAVYRNGAYVGTAVFRGISSGRSRTVALGAP